MSRPSPATIIALIALVVACGGVAAAAIPSPEGNIHACYGRDLVLRVVNHNEFCRADNTRLVWNQKGVPGAPGLSKYKVVSVQSKTTFKSVQTVHAECPAGLDVIGGGASIHANTSKKWLVASTPRKRKGSKRARWSGSARIGEPDVKGFIRADAICASVKP